MKHFRIYIDESELNENIVLGAIAVLDKHRYALDRRLTELRKRMLREMRLQDYPILGPADPGLKQSSHQKTERARLAAGGLPEIHAAELWSSTEVFWQERDGSDSLLKRHRAWLETALVLINEFDVTYRRNVLTVEAQEQLKTKPERSIFELLQPWLTSDISEKKVRQLQTDPYVRLLFSLLQSIEQVAQAEQWDYTIVCDKGKRSEMFKVFDTFTLLKEHGSWKRLKGIDFEESHENALIQLCDVATYIDTKADYLDTEHKEKAVAMRLRKKYLERAWRHTPRPQGPATPEGFFSSPSIAYAELMAMLTEMALLHCGGMNKTLPERRKRLQEVMQHYPEVFLNPFPYPVPLEKP